MSKKQKKMLIRILIASALMILLNVLKLPKPVSAGLYLVTYLVIGYDILRKAWRGILNKRPFDECFLMAVATLGAIGLALYEKSGDYNEAVAVMLFYQIGEFFQSYAVGKSRRNIAELMDIRPDYANVETDGVLTQVDPDEVEIGTVIVVQPGEKVPIDGVILSKSVEEGQTVAASFNTPELFVIAQDLTDMRVIADIDEADIGGVKEGQRVSFTVDAFPDDTFEGHVTQVRQEATTESNVVTYEVVISAPNADLKLKPGLTANVTIFTLEKDSVLTVPSKALRFIPNEALLKKGETIDDCEGLHKLWTKEGNVFKAHKVEVGTTNGVVTEIVGGIAPGTEVLADFDISGGEMAMPEQQGGNPFMPRPGGNRNNNNKSGQGGNTPQRR